MMYKLESNVELKDHKLCDGCQFETDNDSGDRFCCAIPPEGKVLSAGVYHWGHYTGMEGDGVGGVRPDWCPLVGKNGDYINGTR